MIQDESGKECLHQEEGFHGRATHWKNPHVSFPKRWTLDLLDPSQGPLIESPKAEEMKSTKRSCFWEGCRRQAFPSFFHAFHDLSCISASPITSVTRAASPVMPFGSFRILSVSLCEASCLTIKERLQQDWLPMGPELPNRWAGTHIAASETKTKYIEVHLVKAKNNALRHG